ncbi:3-oxoacyl-[acyl-carrier protein] reductase [Burkholderiales bacterium]|nr:3-oxoacyl-[acyl-carrier protein] reductase [Burkholderiales bacterium]
MRSSLEQRVALVTGAGGDIGRGIACALGAAGARVLINDRDATRAAETLKLMEARGLAAAVDCGDVCLAADAATMVAAAAQRWGGLDILVNNAGGIDDALLGKMSEAQWDVVLALNLKAAFLLSRAALPWLRNSGRGRIVNIASMAYRGNVGQTNYAAAKAGLVGLTQSLGLELARDGIAVNCVAPGLIDTPKSQALPAEVRERLIRAVPMRCMGSIEDIAAAVCFFASDAARYTTRQVLHVSGGFEGF